jgi:hypothetical protein
VDIVLQVRFYHIVIGHYYFVVGSRVSGYRVGWTGQRFVQSGYCVAGTVLSLCGWVTGWDGTVWDEK